MAQIILIFDVYDDLLTFRKTLKEQGYENRIETESGSIALPHNSLYHPNKMLDTCVEEAQSIGREINAQLVRCIAIEFNPTKFSAIKGS